MSRSKHEHDPSTWLEEKVYQPRRQHTIDLVIRSVDTLSSQQKPVSLASIVVQSKELDPSGHGVSETAILNNPEARAYYVQHRTWHGTKAKLKVGETNPSPVKVLQIKADRDLARVRQRYMRMKKADLVQHLLAVEQAYAEQQEQFLQLSDELLLAKLNAHTP